MKELSRDAGVVILFVILAALLLACDGGEGDSSQAKATGTLVGTLTPSFTLTPTSPAPPTPSAVPTVDVSGCQLGAAFVRDVTIPDGTRMELGTTFTKTWAIRNTGTCTWTHGYRLSHVGGDKMGAPDYVQVPEANPGEVVDVSVPMKASDKPGTYHSNWRMWVNDQFFGTTMFVQTISQVTPTPTVASVPAVPADVVLYFRRVTPLVVVVGDAESEAAALLGEPKPGDREWRDALALQYAIISLADRELRGLDAPEEVAVMHKMLLDSTGDLVQAHEWVMSYIDSGDVAALDRADELLRSAQERARKYKELIIEYERQHGVEL